MSGSTPPPVLQLESVSFDALSQRDPFNLELHAGQLAYLSGFSFGLPLMGIRPVSSGVVRFQGRTWDSRSVARVEADLRRIGTVVNPRSHPSRIWIGNLDIDENVVLAPQFDPKKEHARILGRAAELARAFGLKEGLPATRPPETARREAILSQWVRAFLPDPLDLLILENPVEFADGEGVAAFVAEVKRALDAGAAAVWIDESPPDFSKLGLRADFVLE